MVNHLHRWNRADGSVRPMTVMLLQPTQCRTHPAPGSLPLTRPAGGSGGTGITCNASLTASYWVPRAHTVDLDVGTCNVDDDYVEAPKEAGLRELVLLVRPYLRGEGHVAVSYPPRVERPSPR